jgi:Xaa-Pro aminopeptidase
MMRIPLAKIQAALVEEGLDGWLLFDFHGQNAIARDVAGVRGMVTRRWCLYIPKAGASHIIYHRIESQPFEGFEAVHHAYLGWRELDSALKAALGGARRIAMEYSPDNGIPYVALTDAGTIEKLRSWGLEIVTSADLIASFLAVWTPEQIAGHRRSAHALNEIKDLAFAMIRESVSQKRSLREHDVVEFVLSEFERRSMTTDEGPICAVDSNAGKPHYEPSKTSSAVIGANQLVLLDLWAKEKAADSVYADITWTGYTGTSVPDKIMQVFSVVTSARDRAVSFLHEQFSLNKPVRGGEVDDAVREVIRKAGYGEYFIHRTGHSIGTSVHGVGPNIDNLETQDHRRLREGVCFSVEPGVYLPEFGIRSEIDVLITNGRAEVTTQPIQTELVTLI